MGHPGFSGFVLFLCFVCFEQSSCLFQVVEASVHGHLIFAGVFRDVDDVLNTMAALSEGPNEKIDVYHADEFTGFRFGKASVDKGWADDSVRIFLGMRWGYRGVYRGSFQVRLRTGSLKLRLTVGLK